MPAAHGTDFKRLSEIESGLDSAFESELHLGSISQGSAREALLDVTELLLIGQGREIDENSGALSSYFNNLTKSASSTLRQIERFVPDGQLPFLRSWNATIRKCISTCSFFAVVEDAFFTCWKGYSSALIDGQNVTFEPLGSELDARLRFFRADVILAFFQQVDCILLASDLLAFQDSLRAITNPPNAATLFPFPNSTHILCLSLAWCPPKDKISK